MIAAAAAVVGAVLIGLAVVTTGGTAKPPIATVQPFGLDPVVSGAPAAALGERPGVPVVVSFFAAWCEPCKRELPGLEALASRAGGPRVVGVDYLDQRADALDLLAGAHVTFPTGYDHDGAVGARWGVDGLPVTVFIGSDGRVVHYHRGQLSTSELDRLAASTR